MLPNVKMFVVKMFVLLPTCCTFDRQQMVWGAFVGHCLIYIFWELRYIS